MTHVLLLTILIELERRKKREVLTVLKPSPDGWEDDSGVI